MQLVERHIIKRGHQFYQEIDRLCFLSKNLYNYANYLIRQTFIFEKKYLNYNKIQKIVQASVPYQAIPAKVSQQILMVLDRNWRSFFEATKAWKQNKGAFIGCPKLPNYKHKEKGRNLLVYTIQAIGTKGLSKGILKLSKTNIVIKTLTKNIKQVRIIPKLDHYVIEVVYEQESTNNQLDIYRIASIDIGLNNLAAITFNQAGMQPLLINGRPLKSINQYFNKQKAFLQSCLENKKQTSFRIQRICTKRNLKINDYLHKASRFIIDYLVENNIGNLVIGKNPNWKQEINLGRQTNQSFAQIPQARFVEMMSYKAKLAGMAVNIQEESFTSKADFFKLDPIPVYQSKVEMKPIFSGRRISRGLYNSGTGKVFSSDVNGSLNIMRKAIPNAFAEGIEGLVVVPIRVTPSKLAA